MESLRVLISKCSGIDSFRVILLLEGSIETATKKLQQLWVNHLGSVYKAPIRARRSLLELQFLKTTLTTVCVSFSMLIVVGFSKIAHSRAQSGGT